MPLGKADNRVNPSPQGGGNAVSSSGGRSGGGGGGGINRRPAAPATVGKSNARSHQISQSVRAVKNFFKQPVSDRHMAVVRDIEQTTCEVWFTFILTVLVGSFFLGGGMYLIWLGRENNVLDFIVVGGVGTLMGFCLTCVGMFLFCKPLCLAHRKRKRERSEEKQQAAEEAEYVSKAKAKLLTLQIADSLTNRRPSNAELYGDEEEGSLPRGSKPGSRVQSGTSAGTNYDPPPPLALPNEAKDGGGSGDLAPPVILRETSADDRLAIANAAERKDVVREALLRTHVQRGHSPSSDTHGSGPGRAIKSSDEVDELGLVLERAGLDQSDRPTDELTVSARRREQGSSADLLEELSKLSEESKQAENHPDTPTETSRSVSGGESSRIPSVTVNVDEEEEEEEEVNVSAQRRRSVLSATNGRRKSKSPEADVGDEDDAIEVIPH